MKRCSKILALAIVAALLMGLCVFASGEAGGSAPAPTSSLAQNTDDMAVSAGISVLSGVIATDEAAVMDAAVTTDSICDAYVVYDTIGDWDGSTLFGHFGAVLSGEDETLFTVGGPEERYEVNGQWYNSVFLLGADDKNEPNAASGEIPRDYKDATEGAEGAGIYADMPQLAFDNIYVATDGYGRSAIHLTADNQQAVIKNSTIIATGSDGDDSSAPGIICMYASSRPVLIETSGRVGFYNSDLISSDWGVYSLDGCYGANIYIVDCYSENTVGGYSMYALGFTAGEENTTWFYGSYAASAQYGTILCAAGRTYCGALEDAPDETLELLDGDELRGTTLANGWSYIGGNTNAVTMQADMSGAEIVGILDATHTVFDTKAVRDRNGNPMIDTMDIYDYKDDAGIGCSYYFLNYIHGAAICIRSENVDMTLDDCRVYSSNDVAIQTVIGFDNMANNIRVSDGTEYHGSDITLRNMDLIGDILHEDYQRKMVLRLESAGLTGAVVSGTRAAWEQNIADFVDAHWDAEDEALGHDKDAIVSTLAYDESYETVWGVRMSLDEDSAWTVSGDSSLYSLSIAEGGVVRAPDGCELAIYVDCELDNEDLFYDYTTGTQVDTLSAGEYNGVVILVK